MANRTYLYAERPRENGTTAIISVGEFSSGIPLAYQLLCSVHAERVSSAIHGDNQKDEDTGEFVGPIAIRASFTEGREALLRFMERFAEVNSKNLHLPEDFVAEEFAGTRKELFDERFSGCTHFRMEPGEVFELVCDGLADFEREADDLFNSVNTVDGDIERVIKTWESGEFEPYRSAQDLFYSLGFGTWSDVLFFQFKNPEDTQTDKPDGDQTP